MARFDDPKYDEEDKQAKTDLIDLMQKVPSVPSLLRKGP